MLTAAAGRHNVVRQFVTFTGVGALGTASHYVTLLALVEGVGYTPVAGSAVGFAVGALVNYALNYRFTFRSAAAHTVALPRFLTVAAVGFCINALIMAVGTRWIPAFYFLVQIFSTTVILAWHFTANRLWTFRETKHDG